MARNRYFDDEIIADKFNGKMLKRALGYCAPYKKQLIKIIIIMLLGSLIVLLPPLYNRLIVDRVLQKEGMFGLGYAGLAAVIITAWGLTLIFDIVFVYIRSRAMAKLGYRLVSDLRRDTYVNMQRLAFDYFDSRPAGKILVRVTSYIDEIANVFTSSIVVLLVDGAKLIVVLLFLFFLEWRLTLVVVAVMVPLAVCLMLLHRRMRDLRSFHRNKHSNRTAYLAESTNGIPVIKAFNRSALNNEINLDLNLRSNASWRRLIRTNELFFPAMDFFWQLATFLVYGVTLYFAVSGGYSPITIGTLGSFIMLMGQFSGPLNNIANVIQQMSVASSNLERVFELKDTPASIDDKPDAYELPEIKGHVTFDNVDFHYTKGTNILENFCLDVEAGKSIALVGPTGGGKTTVVSLISRFYDVSGGALRIDGHNVADVKLHSLRSQIGVMMQDSFVFSGTVIDNIRYGNMDASEEQCIGAAKAAFAHDFISKLPQGYQTKISEQGAELSQGEKQLLSFARVLLSDPKILILDEATSSIDSETEECIQNALKTILKGRTSFIIAHRLSTIKRADCILYIADKRIQEAGTHEQLMAKGGKYFELASV